MFEPGQLTREAEALDARRIEKARAELDAEREYDVNPDCPECGSKLTVQIDTDGYEVHCPNCHHSSRVDAAAGDAVKTAD